MRGAVDQLTVRLKDAERVAKSANDGWSKVLDELEKRDAIIASLKLDRLRLEGNVGILSAEVNQLTKLITEERQLAAVADALWNRTLAQQTASAPAPSAPRFSAAIMERRDVAGLEK